MTTLKNTRKSSNGFADSSYCGVKLSSCGIRTLLYMDYGFADSSNCGVNLWKKEIIDYYYEKMKNKA